MPRLLGFLPVAAVLLTVATAGAHDAKAPRRASPVSATPHLAVIREAPPLAAADTSGDVVRLDDLRGQVVLVSFLYTRCTGACPLIAAKLALLQTRLPPAAPVRFVTVTVDPERDDREVLLEYGRRFRADRRRWSFPAAPDRRRGPRA